MQEQFLGYYRPTESEFRELWASCIFVFDTNSLLNLYRYTANASEDFLSFLENHRERVWIPYQVALEFQENRLQVIAEQVSTFDTVTKLVTEIEINSIRRKFENLQLKKRHSAIEPSDFLDRLDELAKPLDKIKQEFLKELKASKKKQLKVTDADQIRARLNTIFAGRVGDKPASQAVLDEIYKEGELRYTHNIPPGFCESKKKGKSLDEQPFHIYGGLKHKRLYGDLVLWKQLLEKAKADTNIRKVIFVTDDGTEDWWWIYKSHGDKVIGPRPELIEEIREVANVERFYMYKTDQFLKYANQYINADIKPETIRQTKDISTVISLDDAREAGYLAEKAVFQWLIESFPDCDIHHLSKFSDFIRKHPYDHMMRAYKVKYLTRSGSYRQMLKRTIYNIEAYLDNAIETEVELVLVCANVQLAQSVNKFVSQFVKNSSVTKFTIGILELDSSSHLGAKFSVLAF